MKKYALAALALFAAVAFLPGRALAVIVWHCEAHPPGVPSDQHHGFGLTRDEALARALQDCSVNHDNIACDPGLCHIDHP